MMSDTMAKPSALMLTADGSTLHAVGAKACPVIATGRNRAYKGWKAITPESAVGHRWCPLCREAVGMEEAVNIPPTGGGDEALEGVDATAAAVSVEERFGVTDAESSLRAWRGILAHQKPGTSAHAYWADKVQEISQALGEKR